MLIELDISELTSSELFTKTAMFELQLQVDFWVLSGVIPCYRTAVKPVGDLRLWVTRPGSLPFSFWYWVCYGLRNRRNILLLLSKSIFLINMKNTKMLLKTFKNLKISRFVWLAWLHLNSASWPDSFNGQTRAFQISSCSTITSHPILPHQ